MKGSEGHHSPEKGAVVLMVAGALLMLMGVAAMAVDLSALRTDIRADRLAADAAATAGAAHIDPLSGSEAEEACEVAWEYLLLNLEDEGATLSPPPCGNLAGSCDPGLARNASGTAGPYSVTITHPVTDAHLLMGGQTLNSDTDGVPCQRLGISIERGRNFNFAPAIGIESGSTTVGAVGRIGPGVGDPEVVPLLVLEPTACNVLYVSGQGGITVTASDDTPGLIVVDSDASGGSGPNACAANRYSIDAQGNTQGWIRALPTDDGAPSAILSWALAGIGPANPARSYDPNDLTSPATGTDLSDPPESQFRLYPKPQASPRRITRAPIDWRYNCKTNYDPYPLDIDNMTGPGIEVPGCLEPPAPHIDEHTTAYRGATAPATYKTWTDEGHSCNPGSDISVDGDWWVNCPGGLIVNGVTVTFDEGNIVFQGNVDVRSTEGKLFINPTDAADHFVFVRDGGNLLKGSHAQINLERTFVYLDGGIIDLVGGDGGLTWTAPEGGDFEDLALWAEAPERFNIGGQAGNTLTGTFFTPFGNPFELSGQAGQFQTDAQFLTRRLEVSGQAEVRMAPDPDRQTLIPTREVRLIR